MSFNMGDLKCGVGMDNMRWAFGDKIVHSDQIVNKRRGRSYKWSRDSLDGLCTPTEMAKKMPQNNGPTVRFKRYADLPTAKETDVYWGYDSYLDVPSPETHKKYYMGFAYRPTKMGEKMENTPKDLLEMFGDEMKSLQQSYKDNLDELDSRLDFQMGNMVEEMEEFCESYRKRQSLQNKLDGLNYKMKICGEKQDGK